MASNKTVQIAKLAMAFSLPVLLAACSTLEPPARVLASQPQIVDRFDQTGFTGEILPSNQSRVFIDPSNIREDAPIEYRVVKGDTLWDISGRYLNEPWKWTEIWESNPQIENPHLIYPGDTVELQYIDGRPSILLTQAGVASDGEPTLSGAGVNVPLTFDENGNPVPTYSNSRVRLSPTIRHESLDEAIPTIPGDSIQQFLVHPLVIDANALAQAPYIVANDDGRLIVSAGTRVYARGQMNNGQTDYGIYRKSDELLDPITGRLLGHEITHVADAKLLNLGDPSTLMITHNKMEALAGDILLSSSQGNIVHQYIPRIPALSGEGRIISLVNAISQSGRSQVVVLNIGKESNIQAGDVLAIETTGKQVTDKRAGLGHKKVKMPNLRTGVVMVFKTFDKVSYALVMESTRPVRKNDIITGI